MTAALLTACVLCLSQEPTSDRVLAKVRDDARVMMKAFQDDDHGKLADLTFAPWAEKLGSRTRTLLTWRKRTQIYRHQGLKIEAIDVELPREIVKAGKDWLCVVSTKFKFQALEGPATATSHLLALSRDQGKTWRFLDAADSQATKHLVTWVPDLPAQWALPKATGLKVEAKTPVFTSAGANFKTVLPKDWTEGQIPDKFTYLVLENGDDRIHVAAETVDVSPDAVIRIFERNPRTNAMRRLFGHKELVVAGEKAKFVRFDDSNDGQVAQYYLCAFNHHGIAYRVIGLRQGDDAKGFEQAYLGVLQRFAFLADRADWLKKNEGAPTKAVLLGGLASFEIDRPRWIEDTFEAPFDYRALDTIDHRNATSDAWLNVTLHEAQGSIGAELQEVGAYFTQRLKNPKIDAANFASSKGKWTGLHIRGESADSPLFPGLNTTPEERSYLVAVKIIDGIAAWVVLETVHGRQADVQLDFEMLLDSFQMQAQTKLKTPLAFPVRRFDDSRGADVRVTTLLKKATRMFPGTRAHEIIEFTADGKQAIVSANNSYFLEDVNTKKRDLLPIKGPRPTNLALSNDRKWLAWQVNDEITVAPMGFGFSRKLKASPGPFAFGPNNKDLLLIAAKTRSRLDADADYYSDDYRRGNLSLKFQVSKIERVPIDGSKPSALFDWPLIRVVAFELSPDGKELAVVANRDMPRTHQYGGLLYVCKADGSNLRLVNKETADYRGIGWSADGKAIFASRRATRGPIPVASNGIYFDIERIDVATGAATNLTQNGRIERIWTAGSDLYFEIRDNVLPASQQGIFRISADTLVKSASPAAKAKDLPADLPDRIAARLAKSLGKTPLADFVPTEADLARIAADFAAAVKDEAGLELDGTPEALDRLRALIDRIDLASGKHAINVLGVGACYGETLRKTVGAKWHLKPVPFGKWTAGRFAPTNSIAHVVLPFSESVEWARFTGRMVSSFDLRNLRGQECVLVYPPSEVNAVLDANYKDFLEARKHLDDGKIEAALEKYAREMKKHPRNAALAREVVTLCHAVDQPERASAFVKQAVEAGIETTDLLVQYADELAKTDVAKAIPYYRNAVHLPNAIAPSFIKLGKAYQKDGQVALAESCWRRAYNSATDGERNEIRRLMGMREIPSAFSFPFNSTDPPFKDKD